MDTAGIDVPSSRAIAKQLLALSREPDNQPFIVQEQGCLAGLVQYTQHDDIEVVLIATRAIQFLASHPQNKGPMRDFPDLVESLTAALPRAAEHAKVKDFVRGALEHLGIALRPDNDDLEEGGVGSASLGDDEEEESKDGDGAGRGFRAGGSGGGAKKRGLRALGDFRTITLQVENVGNPNRREVIESLVIQMDGVISVTVNPDRDHVLIGTREPSEEMERSLVAELATEGFHSKLVVPVAKRGAAGAQDQDRHAGDDGPDYPEYLEEDEYDDDDEGGEHAANAAKITRQGFSSLEARLEEQRREEEARKLEKSSRLIGKMNSLLSNASSWLMGY